MINYLKGTLVDKRPPFLIVENNNIGYVIEASMQTFYQLPELDTKVFLYIFLMIREEKPVLYGFIDQEERKLFQELLKVNTIGPKAAFAILSSLDVHSLYQTVTHQDVRALQNVPGIGKKTAERLLLELTNRLTHWQPPVTAKVDVSPLDATHNATAYSTQQDAISALIALGYKPQIAAQAVHQQKDENLSTEQLIRSALVQLMKS